MQSKVSNLVDPKVLRITRLFLERDDELFHLQKISSHAKVPLGTTFRLVRKIKGTGLIDTITVGKVKLYKTNKKTAEEFKVLR